MPTREEHLNNIRKLLSERDLQILFLIANGKSNSDVALILYLSPNTIKVAISNILKKLNVSNRTQAVYYVVENGGFDDKESLFECFVNKL